MNQADHRKLCEHTVRFFAAEHMESARMYQRTAARQRALGLGEKLAREEDARADRETRAAKRLERLARRIEKAKRSNKESK